MEVKQREIVLCEFFFSDLKQYKMRPVVVFKTNLPFDDFVGIPISSQLTNLNDDEISHPEFEIDKSIQHKLLITVAPDGYLKRLG
jgi:mRNA interferase MazF